MSALLPTVGHKLVRHIVPVVIITIISVLIFLPLLRQPFSMLVEEYDGALITWIMTWSARSLTENPTQLYQAPIFAPLPYTYTFSDPMLSGAVLGLPFWLLTKEPIVFSTVNYILAVWLTGVFSYLLLKDLTGNRWSGLAGALLISFSSIHFAFYIHLHTFMIQGIPLGLWAWWRFSRTQRLRWLLIWLTAFLFQALNSPLTGYLFLGAHGLFVFDRTSWQILQKRWKWCAVPFLAAALTVIVFYTPYRQAAALYHSARSINDAAHFSLSLNSWWQLGTVRQTTFLVVSGVGGVAVLTWLITRRKYATTSSTPLLRGALLTAIVAFLFSLGPVLKWSGETIKIPFPIPLPYAAAYYILPGMNAFRTPERWFLLSGMMLVIAVVLYWRTKPRLLLVVVVLLLVIEQPWTLIQPQAVASTNNRPAVYQSLDENRIDTALFIPTYVYDDQPDGARQETHRMLWLIGNRHITKLVNGYSGYAPQTTLNELKAYNEQFPHPDFWQQVRERQIDVVVVERDQLTLQQRAELDMLSVMSIPIDATTTVYRF